jgi:hypothetical protein
MPIALPDPPAAPVNLAPNSQWEVMSGLPVGGAKYNVEGTGTMAPIVFRANATPSAPGAFPGAYDVTFSVTGSTGELKVGDLVIISGAGVDPALTRSPLRVIAVTRDASFTAACPFGLRPLSSHAGVATPTTPGVLNSATGDAADGGWKKTTSLYVWREDNAANVYAGATYALGVHKDSPEPETLWLLPGYEGARQGGDIVRFRGATISFGAWVYHKVRHGAGTWQAYIRSDGTGGTIATSPPGDGRDGYQWREVSYVVPADAANLTVGVLFNGAKDDQYYVADPVFARAVRLGPNAYTKPQEILTPVVHISPGAWINAQVGFPTPCAFGYCFMFDVYAETWGQVAPTVLHAMGENEGIDDNPVVTGESGSRLMAWYNKIPAPEISGGFLAQYARNVKSFTNAFDMPFDGDGRAWWVSGVAGDTWYNVSLELDWFLLQ